MATVKISQLELGEGEELNAEDYFPYVVASSKTTKRITFDELLKSPSFKNPEFTRVSVDSGSVSEPSWFFEGSSTGWFEDTDDVMALAIDGVKAWRFWNTTGVGHGPKLQGYNESGEGSFILGAQTNGYISMSGSTSTDAGRNFRLYAQSHATLPHVFQLRRGTTVDLSIDADGVAEFASNWRITRGTGPVIRGLTASAESAFLLTNQVNGAFCVGGSDVSTSGRNMFLYGESHATKASVWELRHGSTVDITVAADGVTTFAQQVRIQRGSATEPGLVFEADDDTTGTGLYSNTANELNIATDGVDTFRFARTSGPIFQGRNATTAGVFYLTAQNNGFVAFSGSTASSAGRNIFLYAESHATDASNMYFRVGSTVQVTIDANGNMYPASGTTGMTNGFFYIPAAAGNPSGTPTSVTGRLPMYYDSTNNRFYIYNGGWKFVALA